MSTTDDLMDRYRELGPDAFGRMRMPSNTVSASAAATEAPVIDTEADERRRNQDFARRPNRPAPATAPEPSFEIPRFAGLGGPPDPKLLGLDDPDVMVEARKVLGDRLGEVALRSRDAHPTRQPGANFSPFIAIEHARSRAILARVAAGKPLDPDAIEAEVGEAVLREFFERKRGAGLAELISAATFSAQASASVIARLNGDIEYPANQLRQGGRLDGFGVAVAPLVAERKRVVCKASMANESMKALRPAIAHRAQAAVAMIGGSEALAVSIREARMSKGAWPGADYRLDELEKQLLSASEKMSKFRSNDPELPEGPLANAAREDRDGILPIVEARRLKVEQVAIARIESQIASLLDGEPAALAELTAIVAENPAAFADGFLRSLQAIPLDAALEAGPVGWLCALA